MKKVIFFDLDGTLIDTSERHYRVYRDILKSFGTKDILTKENFWAKKRTGKKTIELLPLRVKESFYEKFNYEWHKRIEAKKYLKYDTLLAGTPAVLPKLQKNFTLVLVTLRNNRENLFWELNKLKMLDYFENIVIGLPNLPDKSSIIRSYLDSDKQSIDSAVVVGDSEMDVLAGKNLGLPVVAVTYGIRDKFFLEKFSPDFLAEDSEELKKILESLLL